MSQLGKVIQYILQALYINPRFSNVKLKRFYVRGKSPCGGGRGEHGKTFEEDGFFLLIFLQFHVYDLSFKAWGPTTVLNEFQTLLGTCSKL